MPTDPGPVGSEDGKPQPLRRSTDRDRLTAVETRVDMHVRRLDEHLVEDRAMFAELRTGLRDHGSYLKTINGTNWAQLGFLALFALLLVSFVALGGYQVVFHASATGLDIGTGS